MGKLEHSLDRAIDDYVDRLSRGQGPDKGAFDNLTKSIEDYINEYARIGKLPKIGAVRLAGIFERIYSFAELYENASFDRIVEHAALAEFAVTESLCSGFYSDGPKELKQPTAVVAEGVSDTGRDNYNLHRLDQESGNYILPLQLAKGYDEVAFNSFCSVLRDYLENYAGSDFIPQNGLCLLSGFFGSIYNCRPLYHGAELENIMKSASILNKIVHDGLSR